MRFVFLMLMLLAAASAMAGPVRRIERKENILTLYAPEVPTGKVET